jgi:hypothetical protein
VIWVALSVVFLACVLGYWLRRIRLAIAGLVVIIEASVNRAAKRSGELPIGADIPDDLLR